MHTRKMQTIKCICLVVFLFLNVTFSFAQSKEGFILIINTHRETIPYSDCIIKSVIRNLPANYKGTSVFTDNMHALQVTSEEKLEELKVRLFAGYNDVAPKVIILQTNSAWVWLHEEIEKRWGDVPVILCSNDDFMGPADAYFKKRAIEPHERIPVEEAVRGKNVTLIPFKRYPTETIRMMMQLQPEMNELVFISDRRQDNVQIRYRIKEFVQEEQLPLKLTFYTEGEMSMESMLDSLSSIHPRCGILYSSWYKHLQAGHRINTWDYRIISQHTNHPIFVLTDVSVKEGEMAGGCFLLFNELGKAVSDVNVQILNGKQARDIPTTHVMPRYVLNYGSFEKYGFSFKNCPDDPYFYSKPDSLWEEYLWQILLISVLILFLFVAICTRLYMLSRMRNMQDKEIESIRKYDMIFSHLPIAYLRCKLIRNAEGEVDGYKVGEFNPAFERYFYSGELIKGRTGGTAMWTKDDPRYKRFIQRLRITDRGEKHEQFYYTHRESGNTYMVFIYISHRTDVNMFYVDHTELLQVQQMLRTSNHKMELAIKASNMAPWKWDIPNKVFQFDYKESEESDVTIYTINENDHFARMHEDDFERVKSRFFDLAENRISKLEEQLRRLSFGSDNVYEWIEIQAIVDQYDEEGKPVSIIGSSINIDEQKNLENELITAKEQAEKSNQLKSAFLANMSHEIRTPLNSIVGFSGILATTESEEEKREYVDIIERNNTLLLQLINDILDLSRIEAGIMEFVYSDVDLNGIMTELEHSARLKASDTDLAITFEKKLPQCYIQTERIRVTQVMNNFVSNAFKFTKKGGISFGYELVDNDQYLRLYVTDTGCGIPEEARASVFGRFVKLNSFVQGTGLGLSICETIARTMNGFIGVDSTVGEGSTFWIKIPYEPVQMNFDTNCSGEHISIKATAEKVF